MFRQTDAGLETVKEAPDPAHNRMWAVRNVRLDCEVTREPRQIAHPRGVCGVARLNFNCVRCRATSPSVFGSNAPSPDHGHEAVEFRHSKLDSQRRVGQNSDTRLARFAESIRVGSQVNITNSAIVPEPVRSCRSLARSAIAFALRR